MVVTEGKEAWLSERRQARVWIGADLINTDRAQASWGLGAIPALCCWQKGDSEPRLCAVLVKAKLLLYSNEIPALETVKRKPEMQQCMIDLHARRRGTTDFS